MIPIAIKTLFLPKAVNEKPWKLEIADITTLEVEILKVYYACETTFLKNQKRLSDHQEAFSRIQGNKGEYIFNLAFFRVGQKRSYLPTTQRAKMLAAIIGRLSANILP